MILYLDTSALVKRYIVEAGTPEVQAWIAAARLVNVSVIARAEMGAAVSKAARMGWLSAEQGQFALEWFRSEWESYGRLPVSEAAVQLADTLACRYGLRGFDAVHLACALLYHQGLGEPLSFACYDRDLWQAAREEGLEMLPER